MAKVALAPFREGIDELVADLPNRGALPRTRAGVNAPLTSFRRFRCAGASMSIIQGSGPDSGRLPPALEKTTASPSASRMPSYVAMPQHPFFSSKCAGELRRIHAYASRAPST